jgi:hypothetical protein
MIRLGVCFLMLLSFSAYADEPDFSSCKTNNECTLVKGMCGGWVAVNKRKAKDAEEYFSRMIVDCSKTSWEKPVGAACIKGKCSEKTKK